MGGDAANPELSTQVREILAALIAQTPEILEKLRRERDGLQQQMDRWQEAERPRPQAESLLPPPGPTSGDQQRTPQEAAKAKEEWAELAARVRWLDHLLA
ncbi:MAG: hypothetical protein HYZ81_04605 [Nitrospinae bacterium]|nr:hypothetical protein [Nitrospinota bacterium]